MRIYGAGMAGLLAAGMLRRYNPVVHEIQDKLPNNHNALLRFRSNVISDFTGIPFKEVSVQKAIVDSNGNLKSHSSIDDQNSYSYKVTGEYAARSLVNLEPALRYVAPPDFISQLAQGVNFEFNSGLTKDEIENNVDGPIISTIPMPALMKMVDWPTPDWPDFNYRPIWSLTATIKEKCNLYQTIYSPYHHEAQYRSSITGNKLIIEIMDDDFTCKDDFGNWLVQQVLETFGIESEVDDIKLTKQMYGKISPTDENKRQAFILAMTDEYGIYSLGRFATWRQILLDDVVKDISRISRWVDTRSDYERAIDALRVIGDNIKTS